MDTDQRPFDILTKCLSFPSYDQHQWWHEKAPIVAQLLAAAKYDLHQQYQYLCLFGLHIIPMLGPYLAYHRPELYESFLGVPGPLELSQNFTAHDSTVRLAFEPTSYGATSGEDPCNRQMLHETLHRLKRLGLPLDLELYHKLVHELTLTDSEESALQTSGDLAKYPIRCQSLLALDLKKTGDPMVKLYLYPQLKAAVAGVSHTDLIFNTIRNVDPRPSAALLLDALAAYMQSAPPTTVVCFPSCDLVAPAHSRWKLYLGELQVSLARAHDIWTLGGRLIDEETTKGWALVEEVWKLFDITEGMRVPLSRPARPGDAPNQIPIMFNFEVQPGTDKIQPKIYFPLTGLDDTVNADAVVAFFERHGWAEHARTYKPNVEALGAGIKDNTDLHAWLAFSYSEKTGPYLTVYYH